MAAPRRFPSSSPSRDRPQCDAHSKLTTTFAEMTGKRRTEQERRKCADEALLDHFVCLLSPHVPRPPPPSLILMAKAAPPHDRHGDMRGSRCSSSAGYKIVQFQFLATTTARARLEPPQGPFLHYTPRLTSCVRFFPSHPENRRGKN